VEKKPITPAIPYALLVGRVLGVVRESRGITQGEVASKMGLTQSAYSRLERGESVLNVEQLRIVAGTVKLTVPEILKQVEEYEAKLKQRTVKLVSKGDSTPAEVSQGALVLTSLIEKW
jgi:transcriptional regulator with XRE-family HTH domain